jgi:cytoskeletal protein CcmA (bactofilin family)
MRKGGENYIAKNASEPGRSNPDKENNSAPLPPKRSYKNRMSHGEISPQTSVVEEEVMTPGIVAGSGFNVPRRLGSQSAGKAENTRKSYEKKVYEGKKEVYSPPTRSELREYLLNQAPDVVIGDGVEIKGNFQFDGLLRLDGRFQGQFVTQEAGDVVVGPTGVLISDLTGNINRLLIEGGHVTGKIHVANIVISGNAVVKGEIVCKSLEVLDAAEATITGTTMVNFGAFDEALSQEEEDRLQKEQEPVKIISYNKSRSAKTVFEKVSPQELEEIRSNSKKPNNNLDEEAKQLTADLYEEKLEEKRKRREAKKKNDEEEKEIPPITTDVESKELPKKKEQQMTQSDPVLKEKPKAKESTVAPVKPVMEAKQPEEEQKQQKSSISPKNSTVPAEEKQPEQQISTPSPTNRAVERREPEEPAQQEEKKPEKPLTKAKEVVLVSGALGSIPTIAIKPRDNLGGEEEETEEQPRIITAREQETEPLNQSNNDRSDSPTKRIIDSVHSSRQSSPRKEPGAPNDEQQEEEEEKKQDDSLPIASEGGEGEPQEQQQEEQEQPPNDENEMNKYGLSPPTGGEEPPAVENENDNENNENTNQNENNNNTEEQEDIPPSE